jgi:hypothetical protein
MNLSHKSVVSFAGIAAAALLLAAASPRTVHALGAIGATLVRITNTAEAPAIVEDVPHMPSHIVTLLGFVASTSYGDPLIQLLPNGTVNDFFSVPAGKSLVITSVEVTPFSNAITSVNLSNSSGGYYGSWSVASNGTTEFPLSSGIVVPSRTTLYVSGSAVSSEITVYGYLSPN